MSYKTRNIDDIADQLDCVINQLNNILSYVRLLETEPKKMVGCEHPQGMTITINERGLCFDCQEWFIKKGNV